MKSVFKIKNDEDIDKLINIMNKNSVDAGTIILRREKNVIIYNRDLFNKKDYDIFFENYYKEFLNIKGNFKTELEFKDIYESKKLEDLLPKLLNFNLIFKGLTINNKLIIKDFIKEIIDLEKENIIKENSEKII